MTQVASPPPPPSGRDDRLYAPATGRNREPLANALAAVLLPGTRVLEVASGSGEHGVFFCQRFEGLIWQPTDVDPAALASVAAWRDTTGAPGLAPPQRLDVLDGDAPGDALKEWADLVFTANLLHIAPPAVVPGLMRVAAAALRPGGSLAVYGPVKQAGRHTADSNAQFDQWLKDRDPLFGIRDQEAIDGDAKGAGLVPLPLTPMPANNVLLWYRRP